MAADAGAQHRRACASRGPGALSAAAARAHSGAGLKRRLARPGPGTPRCPDSLARAGRAPSTLVEQVIQQSVSKWVNRTVWKTWGALAWLVASEGYRGCMTVWRQPPARQRRLTPLHSACCRGRTTCFHHFTPASQTSWAPHARAKKLAPHSAQGGVFETPTDHQTGRALGAVFVLLLIGLAQIEDVVRDRQRYHHSTAQSVADSLVSPQTLMGPMIHSACVESWDAETGRARNAAPPSSGANFSHRHARAAAGAIQRGHGRAPGACTRSTPSTSRRTSPRGGPGWPSLQAHSTVRAPRLQCGAPIVMVAVGDARGHSHGAGVAGRTGPGPKPGTFHPTYSRGLHAVLPEGVRGQASLTLALDLELVGTERLSIVPLGGNTDVKMTGSWPHPSFNGRFCRQSAAGAPGLHGPVAPVIAGHHGAAGCAGGRRICAGSYDDAPPNTPHRHHTARLRRQPLAWPLWTGEPLPLADRATKYGLAVSLP